METQTQGHMFALNGLSGFFLAVVLLLAIVAGLGTLAILSQQANATNYYKLDNPNGLEMRASHNAAHFVDAK